MSSFYGLVPYLPALFWFPVPARFPPCLSPCLQPCVLSSLPASWRFGRGSSCLTCLLALRTETCFNRPNMSPNTCRRNTQVDSGVCSVSSQVQKWISSFRTPCVSRYAKATPRTQKYNQLVGIPSRRPQK